MAGRNLEVAKSVEAEKFVLRDSEGRPRAMLHVSREGDPFLEMYDAKGKFRCVLFSKPTETRLSFWDSKGNKQVGVSTDDETGTALHLFNSNGETRMSLMSGKEGDGIMVGEKKDGEMNAALLGCNKGMPTLALQRGSAMFIAAITDSGTSTILSDKKGNSRAALNVPEEGQPFLQITDEKGRDLYRKP
jgi:hypothetical protein